MSDVDPVPELKAMSGKELAAIVTGFNGDDMAALLRTDRSRIADLRRGDLRRFSLETLIRFLARVGYNVELFATKPRFNER